MCDVHMSEHVYGMHMSRCPPELIQTSLRGCRRAEAKARRTSLGTTVGSRSVRPKARWQSEGSPSLCAQVCRY